MGKSATSVKADTALRDVVLAGPGSGRAGGDRLAVLGVIAPRQVLRDAVEATDCPPVRRCPLSFQVTAMIILGLCLFYDQATAPVLTRLRSLLCGLDPYLIMHPTLTTPAVSKARARLPCAVMRAIFEAGTRSRGGELMLFGRAAVAADGTVLDLAEGGDNHTEFATPTGGRCPLTPALLATPTLSAHHRLRRRHRSLPLETRTRPGQPPHPRSSCPGRAPVGG